MWVTSFCQRWAEMLSSTVGLELKRRGETNLAELILLLDKWFDCMNTSYHHAERHKKRICFHTN